MKNVFRGNMSGFTLIELLVVVLIVGILASVSVPKMKQVLETRKTTEAEEVLRAVRNEQEQRCVLGKNYQTKTEKINVLSSASQSVNYNYFLTRIGAGAIAKSQDYTIKMFSYKTGELCCEGSYCEKLNKSYPLCSSVINIEDECSSELLCQGEETRSCGCKNAGTQSRECDVTRGEWSEWNSCSVSESCQCDEDTKPIVSESCGNCGIRTRSVSCDITTGEWRIDSDWSICSSEGVCAVGEAEEGGCESNETGSKIRYCTSSCTWGEWESFCQAEPQYTWVEALSVSHTILASSNSAFCANANDPGLTNWYTEVCSLAVPPRTCSFNTCGVDTPAGSTCSVKGSICYVGTCAAAGSTHGTPRARLTASEYHCE